MLFVFVCCMLFMVGSCEVPPSVLMTKRVSLLLRHRQCVTVLLFRGGRWAVPSSSFLQSCLSVNVCFSSPLSCVREG